MTDARIEWEATGRRLGRRRAVPPDQVLEALAHEGREEVTEFFRGYIHGIDDTNKARAVGIIQDVVRAVKGR